MRSSSLRSLPIFALASSLLCATLLLAGSCGSNGSRSDASQSYPALSGTGETTAEIRGTVVDALSGVPVAGASIEGPAGARATSDEHGRFHLTGLPVGAEGDLVARSKQGGEAHNPLRPLRSGTLEVVLRLRKR